MPSEPTLQERPVHFAGLGVRDFTLDRGLSAPGEPLTGADVQIQLDFAVLQSRLRDNLRDERLYGTNQTIRVDRARIVEALNRLAGAHVGHSFNDLCEI